MSERNRRVNERSERMKGTLNERAERARGRWGRKNGASERTVSERSEQEDDEDERAKLRDEEGVRWRERARERRERMTRAERANKVDVERGQSRE